MLVLTRKLQERIHIGDNVTITIVRIQGNTVRVGIEAPHEVRVVRGEIENHENGTGAEGPVRSVSSSRGNPAVPMTDASQPGEAGEVGPVHPAPLGAHRAWRRRSDRRNLGTQATVVAGA